MLKLVCNTHYLIYDNYFYMVNYSLHFKLNDKIFLKDPQTSDLGRQVVSHAIDLIHEIGFESFTFKKLAQQIETTEASVYRYFENKHRLLLYIINLYWSYLEYLVTLQMPAESSTAKLKAIIQLLTHQLPDISSDINLNKKALHEIVVSESSKTYLVKEINEINKAKVFQPYKDLCKLIADVIKEIKREYVFPHSLASTILETAHAQEFFIYHLPGLTDFGQDQMNDYTEKFLLDLVSKTLDIEFI